VRACVCWDSAEGSCSQKTCLNDRTKIIGRKSTVGKKDYRQGMIYFPAHISVDSLFRSMFEIGKPVELDIDADKGVMVMTPINEEDAKEQGWVRRGRSES
jgi:hypothetical protein